MGMRFSVHPHCDAFVDVILGALGDAEAAGRLEGLVVDTDEVSTYVGARAEPAEQRLVEYLLAVLVAASRRTGGGHVVSSVLLSRGCPGEVTCDLRVTGLPTPTPIQLPPSGIQAAAQWSLYPLLDGGSDGEHMTYIEEAIAVAQRAGVASSPAHYATKLTGDLADVLATATNAWVAVGARVPHVVTHLTVSLGSPSVVRAEGS